MAGAAVLCARGALRSGAGLVRVSVPEELFPIVQAGVIEATCVSRTLPPDRLREYQAVVMGPGLGDESSNAKLIEEVLKADCPAFVLDADALNLAANEPSLIKAIREAGQRVILTPHPGEAARLLGIRSQEVQADRLSAARMLAEKTGAVTVLKGAGTLVATPDHNSYINTTGNPGMATGGTGDVLAGVIGALAGQGCTCLAAAKAGAYLHGLAGDLAAEAMGEYGLIASDLVAMIPAAFKKTLLLQKITKT